MIEAKHISVKIGKRTLLHQTNFETKPKEFVAIMGPNGAGKSTLLNCLTGAYTPSTGNVLLNGKSLKDWNPIELAKHRAVLSQKTTIQTNFSAQEIIEMGRYPHLPTSSREIEQQVFSHITKQTNTTEIIHQDFQTLSGGEQQRVHLARVLAQLYTHNCTSNHLLTNKFLFLDEPVNHLDFPLQHQLLKLIRNLTNNNHGVVAVLHDLQLASTYADRIVFIKKGNIIANGTPHKLITKETIEDLYDFSVEIIYHPVTGNPIVVPATSIHFTSQHKTVSV